MGVEIRSVRALVHIITHTVLYTLSKGYMGHWTPRCTVMDPKNKIKIGDCSFVHVAPERVHRYIKVIISFNWSP